MTDLDAARVFVHSCARLVDRRRFQHRFDGAPPELVLSALDAYRNPDGGVGALEPDLRTPASQPIATRYLLDVLSQLPASARSRSMAVAALDWLQTVTTDDGGVPFVLPSSPAMPAAPWLPVDPRSSLLATVQLAAAAHRLELDHPWLRTADDYCWARADDVTPADGYTCLFLVDFLDATPDTSRASAQLDRLARLVPAGGRLPVPGGADGEVLDPLTVAPSPDHAGARLFPVAVLEEALDRLASDQQDDGGWTFGWPAWNPAGAWEWRGAVTVDALRTLQAHGRLDGPGPRHP